MTLPLSSPVCSACLDGKLTRTPFPSTATRRTLPLELVHSDLHGPISTPTPNGYRYWITFIDDATRLRQVYLLNLKSQAFDAFKLFKAWAENQTGRSIKALRDDKGGEYMSNAFEDFLKEHGIERQHTTCATPQQNGVAERTNWILDEGVSALLSDAGLPASFWGEALSCFLHVLNLSPSSAVNGKTPHEAFYGHKPSGAHLCVFGCRAYAHIQKDKRRSFEPKARECIFLGYPSDYKGWKCWDPTTNDVFISRDVRFVETEMPGLELKLSGPSYLPLSGEPAGSVGADQPSVRFPSSVPHVEPASSPDADSDSDSGSEDDPDDPPLQPNPTPPCPPSSPLPPSDDDEPRVPSLPPPGPFPPPPAPSPSPPPPSPPLPVSGPTVTRSGRVSRPMSEWWKVKPSPPPPERPSQSPEPGPSRPRAPQLPHPYPATARSQRQQTRQKTQPGPAASSAEELAESLEAANAVRALSADELVEYAFLTSGAEPSTYKEAMSRDDAGLWHEAAQLEYNSLEQHETWDLAELPSGRKAVGCRWVFRVKENADGTVERYKARLVAKGFAQKPHLDYTETFAPVAKFASLRAVLALAAIEDMEIHSMDVSSAFLNGDLDEEIYMHQPEGFSAPGQEHLVCRLKKALYGLKQSPRQWYQKLNDTFNDMGFTCCTSDHSVWVWAKDGIKVIIPVYVDDLTIACKHTPTLIRVKEQLASRFQMRDLGPISYILGIEVIRDCPNRRLYLSQRKYIQDVLARFNMSSARSVTTPLNRGAPMTLDDCPQTQDDMDYMATVPYLSAVGSLMYLAIGTCPDLSYAVGALSCFNSNPGKAHWQQVQHVFKYLIGTQDWSLCYGASREGTRLSVFSDSDYAGDLDSARSTSGFTVFIGSCLVNWSSKRQQVVARSTTEVEYIAANEAGSDGVWYRHFMSELGLPPSAPTPLWLDNQSAIRVAKNPEHHSCMCHLLVKFHWLRDQVDEGTFEVGYVETGLMRSDGLTKPLETSAHKRVCSLLGLAPLPAL